MGHESQHISRLNKKDGVIMQEFPGFSVGEGANRPGGGGELTRFCQNFQKNCMKLRTFWAGEGARAGGAPLDPSMRC